MKTNSPLVLSASAGLLCLLGAGAFFLRTLPNEPGITAGDSGLPAAATFIDSKRHDATPGTSQPVDRTDAGPGTFPTALEEWMTAVSEGPSGEHWGRVIGRLTGFGSEAEVEMIRQIRSGISGHELQAAAEVIARIGGEDGIEALFVRLWASEGEDRETILRSFSLIDSEKAVNLLASAYSATNDPAILEVILDNLTRAATADTVDFLHEMYREGERVEGQRLRIRSAIERVTSPSAIPALAGLLALPGDPELNLSAAKALAKSGTVEGLLVLAEEAIRHLDAGRPQDAAVALSGIASFHAEGGRGMLEYLGDTELFPAEIATASSTALARLPQRLELATDSEGSSDWVPRAPRRVRPKDSSAD